MENDNRKHKLKCLIMLIILMGIFFLLINLLINYMLLFSASAKLLQKHILPADYYNFKTSYLFAPPAKMKLQMTILMSIATAFFIVYKYDAEYQRKQKNKDIDGSERWLKEKELKRKPLKKGLYYIQKNNLYGSEKSGIILHETENGYYVDISTTNSLVVGTTRSGKGQTFVLPLIRMIYHVAPHTGAWIKIAKLITLQNKKFWRIIRTIKLPIITKLSSKAPLHEFRIRLTPCIFQCDSASIK